MSYDREGQTVKFLVMVNDKTHIATGDVVFTRVGNLSRVKHYIRVKQQEGIDMPREAVIYEDHIVEYC